MFELSEHPPAPAGAPELALETSRRDSSVALGIGATVLCADLGAQAHASELLPCVEELLARAGVARVAGRLALGRIFVGLGPGSYTGLRVGIALALGLARASGAALHGQASFEAMAFEALAEGEEGMFVLDARAGRFYHAHYRRRGNTLEALAPPAAVDAAALGRRCEGARLLFGHPGLLEASGLALPAGARWVADARPSARGLLALGRARLAAGELPSVERLEPLYLAEFGAAARA